MPVPERGDIYHIDVLKSEIVGREFYGPHWWVVLSTSQLNGALKVFTAAPLTSVNNKVTGEPKDHGDFRHFRIRILNRSKKADPGQNAEILQGDSIVLTECLRHFSVERITSSRVGTIDSLGLAAIEAGFLFVNGVGIQRQAPRLQMVAAATAGHANAKSVAVREETRATPGKPADGPPNPRHS